MLQIKNLYASIEGKEIIKGLSLTIQPGQVHAIMGKNGAGKSTLAKILAGHPAYTVDEGDVVFKGLDLLALEPDARAHAGLFMSFQYPIEIPGVSNSEFLRAALNAKRKAHGQPEMAIEEFECLLLSNMQRMDMRTEFKDRNLNEGFSGGEKKRNEILQMLMLEPELVILDETDSGLDIDAMRIVANGVNHFRSKDRALLVITHYQRLLDYIQPDYVHVMDEGTIIRSGTAALALELEAKGYDWLIPAHKEAS
jgi:Fe-S cluster assembly ATP-binding protein